MRTDPPATLHVDSDLDGVRIHLGPGRTPMVRPGVTALLVLGLAGSGYALWFGSVAGAVAIGAGAQAAALYRRMRAWYLREAPLRLTIAPDRIVLTRVFRRRVLHEESLPFTDLMACRAGPLGLRFELTSGVREVSTHFRDDAELRWTAATVTEARDAFLASGRAVPDREALAALEAVRSAPSP